MFVSDSVFSSLVLFFSSVWVAEWSTFEKELLTRLTICSILLF